MNKIKLPTYGYVSMSVNDLSCDCDAVLMRGRSDVSKLRIKGEFKPLVKKNSTDKHSYYLDLSMVFEADVKLFQLKGEITKDEELTLGRVDIHERVTNWFNEKFPVFVQCLYTVGKRGKPLIGQYCLAKIANRTVTPNPDDFRFGRI